MLYKNINTKAKLRLDKIILDSINKLYSLCFSNKDRI